MEKIWQKTSYLARSDQTEVGSQAIEFWTTIAEVELSRQEKQGQVHNYILAYKDFLLQLLLECISNVQIEDEDDAEEEWGVNLASGCCLVKVSLLLKNYVLQPVVDFVGRNITDQQDWKKRYAALIALGAVADGPEKQAFASMILQSSAQLFSMFKDQSIKVREAIAWVTLQICTHHADVMAETPQQTQDFVQIILQSLPDRPRVSIYLCQAIEKLAESLAPMDPSQPANMLTPQFETIAEGLFTNASRVTEDNDNSGNGIIQASLASLTSLCQASCANSDPSLLQMLQTILMHLKVTIETPAQGSQKNLEVRSVLCGLIQVIMVRVGHNVDVPTAENIVALIIQSFQQHQKVTEAGLIAYQGVCLGLKERVPIREFGQYIYNALQ